MGPGSGAWSGGNNYGYDQLSLGYGGFDGGGNPSSSSVISDMINGVKTGVTGGARAAQVAIPSARNSVLYMAKNGPLAAQATLGFAATTLIAPVAYVVGPYALTVVGTPVGQNVLNNAPDFIDAIMPGDNPPPQTVPGYLGWATGQVIQQINR